MKILITGANGFVGHALANRLAAGVHEVMLTGRGPASSIDLPYQSLDITNTTQLADLLSAYWPDIIIHCAALSQADLCEKEKALCEETNVKATAMITAMARKLDAYLLFLSTDFVFDGQHGPYKETDDTGPINYYGRSKLEAERLILEAGISYGIARTSLVYGKPLPTRSNLIYRVKEKLEAGQSLHLATDQFRTATYIDDLVEGILLMITKQVNGIYHLSGKDWLSIYETGIQTARFLGLDDSLVKGIETSALPHAAARPLRCGLDCTKAQQELHYNQRSFAQGLEACFLK